MTVHKYSPRTKRYKYHTKIIVLRLRLPIKDINISILDKFGNIIKISSSGHGGTHKPKTKPHPYNKMIIGKTNNKAIYKLNT
jgi:ribosomal protein S11